MVEPSTPTTAARWPLVLLVALPIVIFAVPALAGHPALPGDDLTQNFPLRVLAGRQLAGGHLPVYDPLLWSGSPLLAGWNAGALYPLTLVFAVVPATGAWTLGLVVTWSAAGLSTYYLCRNFRLDVVPSTLAALSFAYAGAMFSQIVHFGLVTGMAWLPLQLLAIQRTAGADDRRSRWRWAGVLGLAVALTLLAGEPRAIDDAVLVTVLFAAWTLIRMPRHRLRTALAVAAGAGLGICAGAVQWLPGALAVSSSQRAASSAALFTSGSLPAKWLLLLLEPNLLGGTGSFGEPHFAGTYTLLEVTGYVGVFPLVAALALLARLRRGGGVPDWLIWHLVALVGLLAALGGSTPMWHVFAHVPFFGGQRLQSRNLLVVDFALAVLLAYWSNEVLSEPAPGRPTGRRARLTGSLVALAAVVVALLVLVGGTGFERWLGAQATALTGRWSLGLWQLPFVLVDLAALAWIVWGPRLGRRARAASLSALVVADLLVVAVLSTAAVDATPQPAPSLGRGLASPATALHPIPSAVRPVSTFGFPGRFAVYDPDQLEEADLAALGSPDLNLLTSTPSVQGYTAIVDGHYAAETGSHAALGNGQNALAPSAIGNGVLDQLDDTVLVTLPQYLLRPATSPGAPPPAANVDRTPSTRFFGTTLAVTSVSVPSSASAAGAGTAGLEVGLVSPGGVTTWWPPAVTGTALTVALPRPVRAVGVALRSTGGPVEVGAPTVSCGPGCAEVVDGVLQGDLTTPHWTYAFADGPFGVFVNHRHAGPYTVAPSTDPGATGRRATRPWAARPRDEEDGMVTALEVSSSGGVRVTRSVAAIPGWSALWSPVHGPPTTLPVHTVGVVQEVTVPPGHGLLTWSYRAPGLAAALVLSAVGAVGLVVLLAGPRRRRIRRVPSGGDAC